ncbi:MAG: prolyl oligopeptidase family serine peptidase [Pseudomonadota bacterium]
MSLLRRLACLALFCLATGQASALVPLEHFFGNPEFSGALLSPSARYLAVRLGSAAVRDRLAVVDLGDNSVKIVGAFSDADIGHFAWVNDERLVFDAADKRIGQGDVRYGPGLYAVNRDGSAFRQLVDRSNAFIRGASMAKLLPWHHFLLQQASPPETDEVYVENVTFDGPGDVKDVALLRLNTRTGRTIGVGGPEHARRWLVDARGEPRLAVTQDKNIKGIHYRDPATGAWRVLAAFDAYVGGKGAFEPLAFAPDGRLFVVAHQGRDKSALFTFNLASGTLDPAPLIELKEFDFSGSLIANGERLLGVRYLSDARAIHWFDPAMQAVQKDIDASLPSTVNLVSVAAHAAHPWVLVEAYSDLQPRSYLLYNTDTKKFNRVGVSNTHIDPAAMGSQELVRYKARDGLEIPAWLTLPHGSARKNLPLVVMVHGGPYVRGGEWGWHGEAQFLASRGYAVLEPEYRGSTGFGEKHFRAGWKQWGLKMQDDIADGTRWAIDSGLADGKRICIAGASYGGYATLMGLIKDPELYRCGIDWVGVTDINLLYTGHWSFVSDLSENWKQYGMPTLVGDQVKDAEQLKATSPLLLAARIKQPLLLAYGGADMRVPVYHGRKFYDAVKATNPDIEWVVYEEEGHGWALPKNRIDFWGRVEKFLDRQIGVPAARSTP